MQHDNPLHFPEYFDNITKSSAHKYFEVLSTSDRKNKYAMGIYIHGWTIFY